MLALYLWLSLACVHTPKVSREEASYLHFYACTQTLPVALPDALHLAPMEGGYDTPDELGPLVAVVHGALWLDGAPMDNVDQLRSQLIDRGGGAVVGLGGPSLVAGDPPGAHHVVLAIDGAVTLGELAELFLMLQSLGRSDWILLGSPAFPLPVPPWPDEPLALGLSAQIAAAPSQRLSILHQAMEPYAVLCGAMKDALREGTAAGPGEQCRVVMASTQAVQESCKQDAASILTLYQLTYGAGEAVTHLRLSVHAQGELVPVAQTALWSQVLPRLAAHHGRVVNVSVSTR